MNVSLRLVAEQINTGKRQGLFAATPPLEALRILLSAKVTGNKPKVLVLNDISRAFLHARTTSDRYAELCEEDRTEPGDEKQMREAYEVGVWDKGSST